MKILTVFVPERYVEILESLVKEKRFPNRSEAIRVAIRDLIKSEFLISKEEENRGIKFSE